MSDPVSTPTPEALLHEVDARMGQALENFFQRSRESIQDTVVNGLAAQFTPSAVATGQACLDWLTTRPEALSSAFAEQFRQHLAHPESFCEEKRPATLQLVDDETLRRQLLEEKIAAHLTETLRADVLLLAGRVRVLRLAAHESPDGVAAYSPLAVIRALSRGLDAAPLERGTGTVLLEATAPALLDTLRQTYAALNRFLADQHLPDAPRAEPRRREPLRDPGEDVLVHLRSAAAAPFVGTASAETAHGLSDVLALWRQLPASAADVDGTLLLRTLQQNASAQASPAFDLAVLDALAALFEFILADPEVSPRYKAQIAQLQIPALRVALADPGFFSDERHPARRLIDLSGEFSRRFPEASPSYIAALAQLEAAHASIVAAADPAVAFAAERARLESWLADEDARASTVLATEVARLEEIERVELGTLLALENLSDLLQRYPAPDSVLRRLEAAWVPYMASLYVQEAGEGPEWRGACRTLSQLFQSLQPPPDEATRERRLQTIPQINGALRRGLLAQGAEPAQMKDFFTAITATQECWIRPELGRPEAHAQRVPPESMNDNITRLARRGDLTESDHDAPLAQAQALLEGDWVDFDPPHEGLDTARVAWVGVQGYLLFCDSSGEQRFSLDCRILADELRAGRAHIPEQSLTRKAMLRLKTQLTH